MVSFTCQISWIIVLRIIKHYAGCFSESLSWIRLLSIMGMGLIQSGEGLNRVKRDPFQSKKDFC